MLPWMMSCSFLEKKPPVVTTDVICLVYNKKDFQYHAGDAEDTKERLRNDYAVWKKLCLK